MSENSLNSQIYTQAWPAPPRNAFPQAQTERIDELHAVVKWSLDREDDAASTIQELSHRIDAKSELAKKALGYSAELHRYVARFKALLPPDETNTDSPAQLSPVSERVIGALDRDKATLFLIRFLLQHAETTSAILQSAGGRMNSKGFDALWRQAEDERRKIAAWIGAQERHRIEERARSAAAASPASTKVIGASGSAAVPECASVPKPTPRPAFSAGVIPEGVSRIDYHPPQTVKWM